MTREEAKELYTPKSTYHMKMYFIDKIYDDFENQKCTNCKHCDEVNERLIHCSYFEQYMPIEIGKCDLWEGRWREKEK